MRRRLELHLFGQHYIRNCAQLDFARLLCCAIALLLPFAALSNNANNEDIEALLSKIKPIENKNLNDIQILNNRFRIDDDVKEVTLIFFRERGSAPVVLVRPDGSKFHLENDSTNDNYRWFETGTYDMIELRNPMPGPWQAIGNILPESRLIVVANINLNIDPLPKTLFQGETLKLTAHLENAGTKVELVEFRDVVSLSLEFSSTNNPNYGNFGMGTRTIARFEDNGIGFDESARDGVFTGQFSSDIPEGEWRPVAAVRTPLLSREKRMPKVVVHATPVSISHIAGTGTDGYHTVVVKGDEKYIDVETILIDGTVKQPNGDTQRISFTEIVNGPKNIETLNVGYGIYTINLSVFARSRDGRDLVINLPQYSFTTAAPPPPPSVEPEEQAVADTEIVVEEEPPNYLLLVILINVFLMGIGGLLIYTVLDKRKNGSNLWFKRLFNKILNFIPKKKTDAQEPITE